MSRPYVRKPRDKANAPNLASLVDSFTTDNQQNYLDDQQQKVTELISSSSRRQRTTGGIAGYVSKRMQRVDTSKNTNDDIPPPLTPEKPSRNDNVNKSTAQAAPLFQPPSPSQQEPTHSNDLNYGSRGSSASRSTHSTQNQYTTQQLLQSSKDIEKLNHTIDQLNRKLADQSKLLEEQTRLVESKDQQLSRMQLQGTNGDAQLKRQNMMHESEMDRLRAANEQEIQRVQRSAQAQILQAEQGLQVRISEAVRDAAALGQAQLDDQIAFAKKDYDAQLKSLRSKLEIEQAELQSNLSKAEHGWKGKSDELDALRRSFDDYQLKTATEVRVLQGDVQQAQQALKEGVAEWKAKQASYEKNIQRYQQDAEIFQSERDQGRAEWMAKERALRSELDECRITLETIGEKNSTQISDLQQSVERLQDSLETARRTCLEQQTEMKEMQEQLDGAEDKAMQLQERALNAVNNSVEVQAYTTDQLQRVQRLLDIARGQLDGLNKLAEDYEEQILILKRQVREKDKELETGVVGNDKSSAMKRLLEQKNRDLDVARTEARSGTAEIVQLKQKLAEYSNAMQDVASQARRRANVKGDPEDTLGEVDRLQIKLLELKTAQFNTMDEIEDLRHSEAILKSQIVTLTNELDMVLTSNSGQSPERISRQPFLTFYHAN